MKFHVLLEDKIATVKLIHTIKLSKAFSTNDMVQVSSFGKNRGVRLAASKAYEEYILQVQLELHKQGYLAKVEKYLPKYPVFLEIIYSPVRTNAGKPSKTRKDIGNIEKSISDIFQGKNKRGYGYFFADDKQIVGILSIIGESTESGGLLVNIYKVEEIEDLGNK